MRLGIVRGHITLTPAIESFRSRTLAILEPLTMENLRAGSGKGGDTDTRTAFFDQVLTHIADISGPLIIAGPGFVRDDFVKYAKSRGSEPAGRALVIETRRIGRGAVQDVIGAGTLDRLIGDLQLSREVKLMDEVLLRIAQDGAVAYGRQDVSDAIGYGAAEEVLITDTLLHDTGITRLMERAEAMRAKVVVLSSRFEPGERLDALGGIAALLRYRIGK